MISKRFNLLCGAIFLLFSVFNVLLYIDGMFLKGLLFLKYSSLYYLYFNNYFGAFYFLFLSLFILTGLLFLMPVKSFDKVFILAGYLLFITFLPPFINTINMHLVDTGFMGISIANKLLYSGKVIAFVIYFIWLLLSLSLLLFPFRESLVAVLFNIAPLENGGSDAVRRDSILKKEEKREYKRVLPNNNRNKRTDVPLFSKVVFEDYDKRVETSYYPDATVKINKFRLNKVEDDVSEYNEVDTFTGKIEDHQEKSEINDIYKKINEKDYDYYDKLKENWPENWKEKTEEEPADENVGSFEEYIEVNSSEASEESAGEVLSDQHGLLERASDYITADENEAEEVISPLEDCPAYEESVYEGETDGIDNDVDDIDEDEVDEIQDQSDSFTDDDQFETENAEIDEDDLSKIDEIDNIDAVEIESEPGLFPDRGILNENTTALDYDQYKRMQDEDSRILEETLLEFGIKAEVIDIIHGPVVTLFKIVPAPGVKLSKIESLSDNLALRLAAQSIRIIAPIPGEKVVGIEVPNRIRELVSFKEIVNSKNFSESKHNIPIGLGKDIYGNIIVIDLHKMPHVLIAGATGAGKSVCVNVFISSILFSRSPEDLKMILIDPKIVELQPYDNIPHLLAPVITDPKDAINALKYLVYEMEQRYALLGKIGVRDISDYRKMIKSGKLNFTNMPFIVAFVDEFADLMSTSGKEAELLFARLTAKARAVGIHLVLATQRPSTDVITGLIKANVPARFAFQVISYQDSRIILDQKGAEKLLGQGDMLYLSPSQPFPIRLQGAYLSKDEVDMITEHWKNIGEPEYVDINDILGISESDDFDDEYSDRRKDPLFDEAVEIVFQTKKASASYLQRRLNIGYNRAARMVEEMEKIGIVGPMQGAKPREIIGTYMPKSED